MIHSTFWEKNMIGSTFWDKTWLPALSGKKHIWQQILGGKHE
jgi:hypothetical protein